MEINLIADSKFYNEANKKVIGKFKDEAAGIPIIKFIGLWSKMYSYIEDNNKGGKTAKGIKKNIWRISNMKTKKIHYFKINRCFNT